MQVFFLCFLVAFTVFFITFAPVKLKYITFNGTKLMRKVEKTNILAENVPKMALKSYYDNLPDASCPKTEFLNEVQKKTGVSASTVRNWIRFGMKPTNPQHRKIVSEITGIPSEELWKV